MHTVIHAIIGLLAEHIGLWQSRWKKTHKICEHPKGKSSGRSV